VETAGTDGSPDNRSESVVLTQNKIVNSLNATKLDAALMSLGDGVVMELCNDVFENEEINRIIAASESIANHPYVCDVCDDRFSNATSLRSHRRRHLGCSECTNCGLCFKSAIALCQHLSQSCQLTVIICNLCQATCAGRRSLANHAAVIHKDGYVCDKCCQPFNDSNCLRSHSVLHEYFTLFSHQCDTCRQHFRDRNQLEDHVATSHGEGKALFCCCACGRNFENKLDIRRHLLSHGLTATNVGKEIDDGHRGSGSRMRHVCDVCGRSYAHASLLKIHQRSHTGERPFVCEICGQRFKENCLQKHMLVHRQGPRPFACADCPKTFSRVSDLQAHVRRHTGEMGYECMQCGRQFRKKNTLERHTRVHTGERPYVCETCGKSFKIMFHLQLHRSIHLTERAFSCPVCGKAFHSAVRLKKHEVVHTGVKPYTCPICDRAFNRNANMRAHMRVHDGRRPGGGSSSGGGSSEIASAPLPVMPDVRTPVASYEQLDFVHQCGDFGSTFTRLSSLKAHARQHRGTLPTNGDDECTTPTAAAAAAVAAAPVEVVYCKVEDNGDGFIALPIVGQFSDDETNVHYVC
jgi:uncharacterized Zn-finger protein